MGLILPNTIVAGAQKSGTTSLCALLASHPECCMSVPKEPHFFSGPRFNSGFTAYSTIFRESEGKKVIAEGSASYMPSTLAIDRMRSALDDSAKFIFILRSPAKRAYSAYLHAAQRPTEFRSPEEVFLGLPKDTPVSTIAAEEERLEEAYRTAQATTKPYQRQYDDVRWNHRYIRNSFYNAQIDKYRKAFGEEMLHVMIFEDLLRNPQPVLAKLSAFLGIDPAGFPDEIPRENATEERYTRPSPRLWLSNFKQFVKKGRSLKRGTLDPERFPPKASAEIDAELKRILHSETDYWSDHLNMNLRELGW